MPSTPYVHGYSPRESVRLGDQANTLVDLLHHDERYPAGARVLEAGCGTGAQTVILARNNPAVRFVSMDVSRASLEQARAAVERENLANVRFEEADLFRLQFPDASFDAVFVCFVLEHLAEPLRALAELKRVLRPGGTITVIEGDHGSAYFHPYSELARKAIQCLVDLQKMDGGDALIGRRLYPLMAQAGFSDIEVTPRVVYADASRPEMVEGFTRNTFTAMVEGVEDKALRAGMMDPASWRQGIADLYRTAGPDGVFNYTFFKAQGRQTRCERMNIKIGIIGLGRLGSALARGIDRSGHAGGLYGFNRTASKARTVAAQAPTLRLCASEAEVLDQCDLVFLWTEPPDAMQAMEANKDLIRRRRPLLVTCTIGVPLARFTDRWAECLPNVNMPVRKGVTALAHAPTLGESDRRLVFDALASVGSVYVLPPEEIPIYSALCSCGPALYATMLELLADTLAAHRGYDRDLCRRMVLETALGTILLQESDGADAAEVVHRVAHPGGSSEPGVAHLRATLPALYEAMLRKMRKW